MWPDQTERFERLRAALAIAADAGLDIRQGDAVADTAAVRRFAGAPSGDHQHVGAQLPERRRARRLRGQPRRAGARRDVSWVFAESPVLVPELPVTDRTQAETALVLVRWRSGHRTVTHLGDAHPHGYWLHWR